MCVLSKDEIERLCREENLLRPYDLRRIKYASYDLTVGEEYRLSHEKEVRKIGKNGVVKIPPYSICFILAEEKIKLPKDVCAFIFSRHRAAREGFLMHPQPPLDPGYEGCIYILFHNLSNRHVVLKRGEHLATIVFLRVSPKLKEGYGSNKDEDRYMEAKQLEELVGNYTYTPALREIRNKLRSWTVRMLYQWMPMILTLITIIIAVLTFLVGWRITN
jgi:dCTP deaminase